MVIKSKIFIQCNAKEFDRWSFRQDWYTQNLMSNVFFLVGDYHIWSFTNVQRKSVGLEPVINSYQFHVHWSDAKIIVSSANWANRIWFEDLCMSLIYKRKSNGPNTDPCGTPNVMFDIEELELWLRHIVSNYWNKT